MTAIDSLEKNLSYYRKLEDYQIYSSVIRVDRTTVGTGKDSTLLNYLDY